MVLSTWNSEYAMAMYKNDMFLLCETSNAFVGAFCYSKIHFHPSGPFKSITCFVRFISSLELLSKEWSQERDYLAFNNRVLVIGLCKFGHRNL